MIHQVVYNLVENATKFTNVGGRIDVDIEDKNSDVWVSITNTGPGIPPEQIGYIFDRFYKTDKSRSVDKNGMGLGLYIVKTIIRLHEGEISAESEEGKYTRFKFRLPKKSSTDKKRSLK
ncbi:MAG: ATP-binding protein, partial [Clostridia bacterium]|nr:ATP-binding protein [Clostridia bacterium]